MNLLNIYRPSTFLNFSAERSIKEGAHEFSSIQGGAPMVINWFMNPMNTSSIYHQQKPTIVNLEFNFGTNLAVDSDSGGTPFFSCSNQQRSEVGESQGGGFSS